ncbi:hypothetical protein ACHAW6_006528 [Cyclotella cf. meneghiniana]
MRYNPKSPFKTTSPYALQLFLFFLSLFSHLYQEVSAFQISSSIQSIRPFLTMTHSSDLPKDGSHNHPARSTAVASASSPHDHALRDGSHNHPTSNTMELIQSRLSSLNLTLPPPGSPKANYHLIHRDGDLLYLSGHLPMKADGSLITGCCAPSSALDSKESNGEDPTHRLLTTQQGYDAARICALNLLSTLQAYLSTHVTRSNPTTGHREPADLSSIVKIVKLFGIVRSHPEFTEQHLVMNGASDVLGQVLGKDVGGCHARSAIGTNTLPLGICVEVELIAKIHDS